MQSIKRSFKWSHSIKRKPCLVQSLWLQDFGLMVYFFGCRVLQPSIVSSITLIVKLRELFMFRGHSPISL